MTSDNLKQTGMNCRVNIDVVIITGQFLVYLVNGNLIQYHNSFFQNFYVVLCAFT